MKNKLNTLNLSLVLIALLSACSALPAGPGLKATAQPVLPSTATPAASQPAAPAAQGNPQTAPEGGLEALYQELIPSVVNIQVTTKPESMQLTLPFGDLNPFQEEPPAPRQGNALGSGFVYDSDGHIVTNNHVVEDAESIMVTFNDGTMLEGKLVGSDRDADLAVIQVQAASGDLKPVVLADSDLVKVGQRAIAIGSPFGLEGSMTEGIISALGRSLETESQSADGPTYTIPDVIQTDAPINPGNSGGILVNLEGEVVGVTAAIASPVRANAGVGFVIPSNIVRRVVPELIRNGKFEHPWLGVSGTSLLSLVAQEMGLSGDQRGVLMIDVTAGSPADKAGLQGSSKTARINGREAKIGGDVILSIGGEAVEKFDDLAAYLVEKGEIGKPLALEVLRDGKKMSLEVTLQPRPHSAEPGQQAGQGAARAWMGIKGTPLTREIAGAMELGQATRGVLVLEVVSGGPADKAGLQGSSKTATLDGTEVQIGGDVITALDGEAVKDMTDLKAMVNSHAPGDRVRLDVLRNGKQVKVEVELAEPPNN